MTPFHYVRQNLGAWILLYIQFCAATNNILPVGLEGDLVIARHLTEIPLQLSEELLVALCLIQRHKRVDVGKLPPGDGLKKGEQGKFNFPRQLYASLSDHCLFQ